MHGCLEPRTTAGTVSGTEQRVRQRHVDSEGCPKIPWYHCVQLVVQLVTICASYCIAMIPYDSLTFERPQKQRCKALGLACWPWCGLCNFYIARSGEGQSFCSRAPNVGMGQSPSLAPVFVPTWVCVKIGCPIPSNYWLITISLLKSTFWG